LTLEVPPGKRSSQDSVLDGDLGLMELTETGEPHFISLETTKLLMNKNRKPESRPFRPYVGVKLPPEVALRTGRREVTVAISQTEEDKKRGNLRTALQETDTLLAQAIAQPS
jgi:hypothetical protein